MSIYRARLRIIAPFLAFTAVVVALIVGFVPRPAPPWTAAVPWVLLVLFWVYFGLMSRRERRRGRAI